jgi:hypothetical protein
MSKKTNQQSEPIHELSEFLAYPSSSEQHEGVPPQLLQQIRRDLSPKPYQIGLRLAAIHAIAGGATLLVCPQFGVGPWGGGHGLMGFFMQWGDLACALGCGAFFASLTAIATLFFLSRDELRILKSQGWAYYSGLMALSVGVLMLLGDGAQPSLDYIIPWFFAAVGMGQLLSQVGRPSSRGLSRNFS